MPGDSCSKLSVNRHDSDALASRPVTGCGETTDAAACVAGHRSTSGVLESGFHRGPHGTARRRAGREGEWCRREESNSRPSHYECAALPTELRRRHRTGPRGKSMILADDRSRPDADAMALVAFGPSLLQPPTESLLGLQSGTATREKPSVKNARARRGAQRSIPTAREVDAQVRRWARSAHDFRLLAPLP